ncbi:MAG: hypothetical protein MUC95_08360, partial [Spirochaetes bacterium]|nr:hypothetical protein [Spirochaetota bacterium]
TGGADPAGSAGPGSVYVASLILSQAFVNWHKAFMRVLEPFKLTYSQWIILHTFFYNPLKFQLFNPPRFNPYKYGLQKIYPDL